MPDEIKDPQGQSETPNTNLPGGGQENPSQGEAPKQDVPEKLQGKDSTELVKMYGDLERKLGETSTEINQARQLKKDMQVVLDAIYSDPELKSSVEKQMQKVLGHVPEDTKQENPEISQLKDTIAETRRAQEADIIQRFEQKNGLDQLDSEQRVQVYKRIGDELRDMLNPGGNKTQDQIMDSIDLTKLPLLLDKALKLANTDDTVQKAVQEGVLKARQNQAAMIGSIPSSSSVSGQKSLTDEERQVARRLGISEEDYLKHKEV